MDYINLNDYKKTVFVEGITEEELVGAIKKYEELSGGSIEVKTKMRYAKLNDDWTYIEYIYGEHEEYEFDDMNFWHYQNFLLWVADKAKSCFSYAYTDLKAYEDAFYSRPNSEDDYGESVTGICKGAEFLYSLPGMFIDWWTGEGCSPVTQRMVFGYRSIDESLLEDTSKFEFKEIEIIVTD